MDSAGKSWSEQLLFISNYLANHKESIESLAEVMVAFQKQIGFLLQTASQLEQGHICSSTTETDSLGCATKNENKDGKRSKDRKNLSDTFTVRSLLEKMQTSFQSEGGKLQTTFRKLEQTIKVATDRFNPDCKRTGVDKSNNAYRSNLEQYIDDLLGQLNDRKRENESLKRAIEELNQKAYELEALEASLQIQLEILRKENETLKLEVTKIDLDERPSLKKNASGCMQLYYKKSGAQIAMVVQGIMSLLNTDEHFGNRKLTFTLCEHLTHIQAKLPLLVLCFNISGIATDVTNTLKGIPQSENTAVLIFHHKDEHALPNQSSNRVLVNPEFKTFGGIFDMAFLAGKGIYSCEMSTNALAGIVKFLTNVQKVNDRT